MKNREDKTGNEGRRTGEQGFMLLGLIVAVALILIALSVAASKVAFSLRREREVESAHRANQYVRAIQLYYRKMGMYPASVAQLENTNNIRYLRKQYVDPLTGKADYRLIAVGQNKTTVKGFFGEPLTGLATGGLGAAAGMQSSGFGGTASTTGASGAFGSFGATSATGSAGATGTAGSDNSSGSSGSFGGSSGFGSPSGPGGTSGSGGPSGLGSVAGMGSSGMGGSVGPIMGVGSSATGNSILQPNQQSTYQTWEFLYDPRVELLKAAAALNGGAGSVSAGALGQSQSGFGQSTNGFGSNGFGQSQSGAGQPSNGFGQSPSTPGGTSPTSFP